MSIYAQLPIVAAIVCYIVDISGFTEAWRSLLSRILKVKNLRPLPPFDCGQCMVFWVCLLYTILLDWLSLLSVAECALLSLLSVTIDAILLFVRESLLWLINKIMP